MGERHRKRNYQQEKTRSHPSPPLSLPACATEPSSSVQGMFALKEGRLFSPLERQRVMCAIAEVRWRALSERTPLCVLICDIDCPPSCAGCGVQRLRPARSRRHGCPPPPKMHQMMFGSWKGMPKHPEERIALCMKETR